MTAVNPLPNLLTWARILAGLLVFALLAAASLWGGEDNPDMQWNLMLAAIVVFLLGAVTDFLDGFLARKLHAETPWGATLDPIADKILVTGTILGLFALNDVYVKAIAIPSAIILFREFTVAGLREAAATRGKRLPVTFLAKWKTTAQLFALALELLLRYVPHTGLLGDTEVSGLPATLVHLVLWAAALLTLWTGWEYVHAARKALPHEQ
jgi:CDP-diacylglycerol--glycerol-3-phosphate 3-phosphatidyltransferase